MTMVLGFPRTSLVIVVSMGWSRTLMLSILLFSVIA